MSNEISFQLATIMESALALADDCIQQAETCCKLHRKLKKLNESEQKGDLTSTMLILAKYGSKTKFIARITNATSEFDNKTESLETHAKEMKKILQSRSFRCPKCHGRGNLSKWDYIRERGTVQPILRTYSCENCDETGEIAISSAEESYLLLFLEMTIKIIQFQKYFRNIMHIFNISAAERKTA